MAGRQKFEAESRNLDAFELRSSNLKPGNLQKSYKFYGKL